MSTSIEHRWEDAALARTPTAQALAALLTVLAAATALAQSPALPEATLRFEVASIRRNLASDGGYLRIEPGARFNAVGATPMLLIRQAYGKLPFQLANVPDWAESEQYDIRAKAPDGVEVAPNMPQLLRSLLRERFRFEGHLETRQLPAYDLLVARADRQLGPGLRRATVDCAARKLGAQPPIDDNGEPLCGLTGGPNRIVVRGYPLARFAGMLTTPMQRMVMDKTGLIGSWNLDLRYTPDQPANPNGSVPTIDQNLPSLVTAIQEQLGLKLEPSRAPVEVLVIDRISRPTSD
jgi:uncharacterized protein (TIGR03435 family)